MLSSSANGSPRSAPIRRSPSARCSTVTKHDVAAMLRESLDAERAALELYKQLLHLVEGRAIALEEFARQMIHSEELHAADVDKMLRKPGEIESFSARLTPRVINASSVQRP